MRDLQVQESLRELIVGVTAPGDLAGSILVKILHSGKGRDVEQMCSKLKTNSLVFAIAYLSLSFSHTHKIVFIYLECINFSFYMFDILVLY